MMTKNIIRRFGKCKRLGMDGGCDHFKWVNDALCDRVRSMVVALMVKNETHDNEIEKF